MAFLAQVGVFISGKEGMSGMGSGLMQVNRVHPVYEGFF